VRWTAAGWLGSGKHCQSVRLGVGPGFSFGLGLGDGAFSSQRKAGWFPAADEAGWLAGEDARAPLPPACIWVKTKRRGVFR
jgi:hypothetical protein